MAPQYASAARQLRSPDVQLVKVDCTANTVCQKFNIRGYPTLKFFVNGKYNQDYGGERTHQGLVKWMFEATNQRQQKELGDHNTGIPEENGVLILTSSNFNQVLEQYEFLMVDFYAPWCGHW